MTTRHATTTCPTCGGTGQTPVAPGAYRIAIHYQDGTEYLDFSPGTSPQAVWSRARKIAKGDPSCTVAVIRPDGSIAEAR